ncbi:MAG TPA: hypothetical protein GX528_01250 [Firmicutes bacterium]|nr:hypothetical protein [Bacillota bacterium]
MKSINEKIAYLRGIIDGDTSLEEERIRFLFEQVMLVLEELAKDLESVVKIQEELEDYVQEIDFDLMHFEDDFYDGEEWEEDDSEMPVIEFECPQCAELLAFDGDFLLGQGVQITCPHCGAVVMETDDSDEFEELPRADWDEDLPDEE